MAINGLTTQTCTEKIKKIQRCKLSCSNFSFGHVVLSGNWIITADKCKKNMVIVVFLLYLYIFSSYFLLVISCGYANPKQNTYSITEYLYCLFYFIFSAKYYKNMYEN